MAVTIKDIMGLEIMRDFKLVAGEKGLDRTITCTEILDFEFIQEGEEYRERSFEGNSIVLSSLLFAKDQPELVLEAVKKLIAQNVQAFAYKPIFFKNLPTEALDYANRRNFPILEFGHDEFFEDIIFDIKEFTEKADILQQAELLFGQMLSREFTREEAEAVHDKINSSLRPIIQTTVIKAEGMDGEQVFNAIRRQKLNQKLSKNIFVGKYEDKFFVVLSQDEENPERFKAQFADMLLHYGLMGKKLTIGLSQIRSIHRGFDETVRQAFWTERVAEIEKKDVKNYSDLGIYKLIISNMHTGSMIAYMEEYLSPLFEEEEHSELLHTAVEYILEKGDILKTAERLFCHKNTIRYRIGKLQEKLDPETSEKEFYQNLAVAIQIYLLVQKD